LSGCTPSVAWAAGTPPSSRRWWGWALMIRRPTASSYSCSYSLPAWLRVQLEGDDQVQRQAVGWRSGWLVCPPWIKVGGDDPGGGWHRGSRRWCSTQCSPGKQKAPRSTQKPVRWPTQWSARWQTAVQWHLSEGAYPNTHVHRCWVDWRFEEKRPSSARAVPHSSKTGRETHSLEVFECHCPWNARPHHGS
jgi:hypothetical protein